MNKNDAPPEIFTKLVFTKLTEGLADSSWSACNDPAFEASFNSEEQMMMEQGMNIGELAKWIEMMVRRTLEGAEFSRANKLEN